MSRLVSHLPADQVACGYLRWVCVRPASGSPPTVFCRRRDGCLGILLLDGDTAHPSIDRIVVPRSDERVGDTQSAMAIGRAIGPAVGGLLVGTGTFAGLATFAVVGLAMAGVTVIGVASHRRGLKVPSMTSPSA